MSEAAATTETTSTPTTPELPADASRDQLVEYLNKQRGGDEPAAAPAEPAKEVAPVAEEPKADSPKMDERVAARILAAKRAELRASKERDELRSQKAAQEAKEKELAEREAKLRAFEEDPASYFGDDQDKVREHLERLAKKHDPVAQQFSKKLTEIEKALAEEREARQKERAEFERQRQLTEINATTAAAKTAFIEHIAATAEQYPHLTDEYTPDEIANLGMQIAEQQGQAYFDEYGEWPSDEVIARHLEAQAKQRAEQRSAWRARVGKSASKPSQGVGEAQSGQSVTAGTPRTLTNGSASQKAAAPKPWSQKDADEESLRIIRQMHAAND